MGVLQSEHKPDASPLSQPYHSGLHLGRKLSLPGGFQQNNDPLSTDPLLTLLTPSEIHWGNEKNKTKVQNNKRLNQVHKSKHLQL